MSVNTKGQSSGLLAKVQRLVEVNHTLRAKLKAKDERIETQKQAISFLESRIGNRSCENCNPTRMGVKNRDCQNCFWHPDSGLYDHFIPNSSGYTPKEK